MTPEDPIEKPMSEGDRREFDRRRKTRAIVTAVLLLGMVALFYFIAMAKMLRENALS